MHLRVRRFGHFIVLDIKANAFLHHMVRNITGTLLQVGLGQAEAGWVQEVLDGRDRNLAGATAKAGGLYLVEVDYPPEFGLPKTVPGPLWLPDPF